MMVSHIDLNIWGANSSVKDMNHCIIYRGDLLIVVKACVEPTSLCE